ncbi:bifunctional cobalt-precorrin-7 (C(5))-methyltransferase/cobalt-precorrin-6B (C(15))-methyltransferase [Lutispora thermophila]|uniref:Precorrin-6Y C5,15-methyltransferase (Decarboxylating) n=1 Tax=Lutispora thermophila DSM 19022 TaxID=1122184 RepID=A0A1M6D3N2_9FIRM|nr:bifunctional cobalt-precorrin-7 (C(5))-methyltransferase/cobalt-precorrin-6B (C(15))-methyltransferase [Lutispora thermophila]SHI67731.1 precorrin-6Y C5,15-methyltransferase (decarboxylating) [Lutispora thermophila DSM 19022]
MGNKLYVIGMGPGSKEFVHTAANELIEKCHVLIGGRRNLEAYSHLFKETLVIGNNLDEIYRYISSNIGKKSIAVLASGDPALYGIMSSLKENIPQVEMEVIPGVSSLQYLCSKLQLNWNDIVISSVHGRQQSQLYDIIKANKKTAIFTGGKQSPDAICRKMIELGLSNAVVAVGENLSYENERIKVGTPDEIGKKTFDNLSLMIIQHKDDIVDSPPQWEYSTPGIPDNFFVRGDVPMTKEEVRSVSISKLRLKYNSIVYDIGAGTGSVSIECGLICKYGKVYAIEKDSEGIKLIGKNAEKFGIRNINIVNGEAPGALEELPRPNRVFIGGTDGNMGEILDWIHRECSNVRVVLNTVTIESTCEAIGGLKSRGFINIEIINLSVSRGREAGGKHLMTAINPIYIITAEKGE